MADGFSETLIVGPREERLNGKPQRPLGTLAAEVLNRLPEPLPALTRALTAAQSLAARRALDHVLQVRTERAVSSVRFRADAQDVDGAHLERVREDVRALARDGALAPTLDPPLQTVAQWRAPYGDGDLFRTTPAGAILLSGVYGVVRGRLRVCRDCKALVLFPRGRWIGRYCNACHALRDGRPQAGESLQLAGWKRERWAKVQDRMRKRGFARLARTQKRPVTDADRDQWTQWALAKLHHVTTFQALEDWEQLVAPRGMSGRPKSGIV